MIALYVALALLGLVSPTIADEAPVCVAVEELMEKATLANVPAESVTGEAFKQFLKAQETDGVDIPDIVAQADTAVFVQVDKDNVAVFIFKDNCYTGQRTGAPTYLINKWLGRTKS